MAYQSLAMGEAFGSGFQYGKRRISAMANEDFNRMSFVDMAKDVHANIEKGIPTLTASMTRFTTLQTTVIEELISYVKLLGPALLQFVQGTDDTGAPNLDLSKLLTAATQIGGKTLTDTAAGLASNLINPPAEASPGKSTGGTVFTPPPPPPPIILTPAQLFAIAKAGQTVGPQITAEQQAKNTQVANQANNTIVITADGKLINKDVRKPVVLSTPPRSQITQYGKYTSELNSLTYIFNRVRWSVSDQRYIDNRNRYKTVLGLMRLLWNKYDFRSVNVVKKH